MPPAPHSREKTPLKLLTLRQENSIFSGKNMSLHKRGEGERRVPSKNVSYCAKMLAF